MPGTNGRAGLIWYRPWTNSPSTKFTPHAVTAGAKDVFGQLGIQVVATTDAEMDSKKQQTDLETVLALKPNVIISLVIDPVSAAVAYKKAVE